ncbi:hypothetical protein [Nonomuraea sp. NPDC049607]
MIRVMPSDGPANLRRGIAAEVAGFTLKDAAPDELASATVSRAN